MIKSKVTGFIDFGNGPIEVQGEAISTPLPIDEALMERIRHFSQVTQSPKGDELASNSEELTR